MTVTARADLRGFLKAALLLLPAFAAMAAVLHLAGADLRSQGVRLGFWFPIVGVTAAVLVLGCLWRAFWRLELADGSLTWHMLTRKKTVPIASIEKVTEEIHLYPGSHSHVLAFWNGGAIVFDLEISLWKESELKAVVRELQRLHPTPVAPEVERWVTA